MGCQPNARERVEPFPSPCGSPPVDEESATDPQEQTKQKWEQESHHMCSSPLTGSPRSLVNSITFRSSSCRKTNWEAMTINLDGLVKSRKYILSVIPAKAGIQCSQEVKNSWTPFFNGVTTFYEIVNLNPA
jgi:hypothetical protein